MKLIELISFYRQGGSFADFCKQYKLNEEAEVIEIYAQEPTGPDAELGFFPIEETEGRVQFESEGVSYCNLFDFFYFLNAIDEVKCHAELTDAELAQKLFTYAIKDA